MRPRVALLPLLALAAGVASQLAARSANAAPAPSCSAATMRAMAASLPVNFPGFAYSETDATANDVHLFALDAGRAEVPLTVGPVVDGSLKVTPASALTAGAHYELDWQPFCDRSPYPAGPLTFVATSAAPLPTAIGDVASGPTFTSAPSYAFHLAVTYSLAEGMKPWAGAYVFSAEIDGSHVVVPAPAVDASGGTLTVSADGLCASLSRTETTHAVTVRATLPFAADLTTTPATATFDCAPAPSTPAPGSSSGTPGGSGNTVVVTDQNGSKSGCAMTAVGARGRDAALAGGALVMIAATVARRRRRSSAATRRR